MKKIIDKYLNLALNNYYSIILQDADCNIEDHGYYMTADMNRKSDSYEIKVKGKLSENHISFSIQELDDIDQDHKYLRKTLIDFFKREDNVHYEKLVEDRINVYDYDNSLIRSKLERKSTEMDNLKIAPEDINKDLLSDIKITKKTHVLKK